MITLSKKQLEAKLKIRLKDNCLSLGIDPASKTGWAIIDIKDGEVNIDYGVIAIDSKDPFFKFNELIKFFESLIQKIKLDKREKVVIIEDCWLGRNVAALKMLARIGMIAYVICYQKDIPRKIISPLGSRSALGFKGKVKKNIFQAEVMERLKFDMTDEDAIDALVLGLNGVIEPLL
jgi:Holliday junction resolvasome RuvABC endonuclease subunit